MSLSTGDIIEGKYRIVRLIGEGGMGAVYEGENVRIHRTVAIKVLHAGVAENEDAVQRFEREAQAAGRIGSEHICEVLDLGNLPSGDRFMVMEFMDGVDLSARIQEKGRLTAAETYAVAIQILEGLKSAHAAGIIHRDLKPDNVYLLKSRAGTEDFVKILDFGISKFSALSGESGFSMTRTGAVMGTPYYMSPEQAKGAKGMDARADLYSVGVILYECLTGQVPFNADTFNELLFKIVLETPPPLETLVADIDPNFASLVTKAMAREPAHRFASAQEFREALDEWAKTGVGTAVHPAAGAPGAHPTPSNVGVPVTNATTPGAWANTGTDAGPPVVAEKSKAPLLVAAAAVMLLVGGGAAFALSGGGDEPVPAATGPTEEELAQQKAQEETLKKLQESQAEMAKAAAEAKKALAEAKTAQEKAAAQKNLLEAERKKDEEDKKAAAAAAAAAGRSRPVVAAPAPKPAVKPTPKPATKPGGRTIRTEL